MPETPPVDPAPGQPEGEVPGAPAPGEPGSGEPAAPAPRQPEGEEPAEPAPAEPEEPVLEEPEIDPVTGMPVGTPGFERRLTGARGPAGGGGKALATIGLPSLSSPLPDVPDEVTTPTPGDSGGESPASDGPALVLLGNVIAPATVRSLRELPLASGDTSRGSLSGAPATGADGDGGGGGGASGGNGPIFTTLPLPEGTAGPVVAGPLAGAVGLVAGAVGSSTSSGGGDAAGGGGAGTGGPGAGGGAEEPPAGALLNPDLAGAFDGFDDLIIGVPEWVWIVLAVLAVLSLLLALAYLLATLRARSLGRQRRELLQEVGLLQSALLPPVPDKLGGLRTSVAYRPADGPGAGGDFYDVLPLAAGSVGFILGDVSGHGRGALARTAFMRYTLRAYLEAGLEPRVALQVAGRVIDENLGGDFATVLLAVHDPATGSLTYATAGHPAPIIIGPEPHVPVTTGSSPPIGVGVKTGLRQTTLPLVPGATAALFTDGLMEARVNGTMLGRERLEGLLGELGDEASARGLIERVAEEAGKLTDDIAAVVVSPTVAAANATVRTEQLELTKEELESGMVERFFASCGVPEHEAASALDDARVLGERFGGAIVRVVFAEPLRVDVFPSNVETIEAASRRSATG